MNYSFWIYIVLLKHFNIIYLSLFINLIGARRNLQQYNITNSSNYSKTTFIYDEVYMILKEGTIAYNYQRKNQKYLKIYQINRKVQNENEVYYYIENKNTKKFIGVENSNITTDSVSNLNYDGKFQWKFISFYNEKDKLLYFIQNKHTKKYLIKKATKLNVLLK